jgi:hypothetical protein
MGDDGERESKRTERNSSYKKADENDIFIMLIFEKKKNTRDLIESPNTKCSFKM